MCQMLERAGQPGQGGLGEQLVGNNRDEMNSRKMDGTWQLSDTSCVWPESDATARYFGALRAAAVQAGKYDQDGHKHLSLGYFDMKKGERRLKYDNSIMKIHKETAWCLDMDCDKDDQCTQNCVCAATALRELCPKYVQPTLIHAGAMVQPQRA